MSEVLLWESGAGSLHSYAKAARDQLHDMHESGNRAWGRHGVAINRMRGLRGVPYHGEHFDNNVAVILPKEESHLPAIWCFCSSPEYNTEVRRIDQTLKVTNVTLTKVPFDLDRWTGVARERYPNGLPQPYSDDPKQWIFHGHPCGSVDLGRGGEKDHPWTASHQRYHGAPSRSRPPVGVPLAGRTGCRHGTGR